MERVLTKALSEGEIAEFKTASLADTGPEEVIEEVDPAVTYPVLSREAEQEV